MLRSQQSHPSLLPPLTMYSLPSMPGMVVLSIDGLELQRRSRTGLLKIAANARKEANACNSNSSPVTPSIDRRELLAGAIAGGASLAPSVDSPALADPIGLPTFKRCHQATISGDISGACCPPKPKRATIDFKPEANKNTRVSCAEYVGTYSNVPHFMSEIGKGHTEIVNATFSIKANVEILGLKSADKLVVTLVPTGQGGFTFNGAFIQHA
ncbi:hypothetical protein SELMODRAFT_414688 [Selaginella moellendorffii]|uniref:Polyphenol oxidase C-terminal domain-containing protein n=1 Tax=Selaginella moellendorffii TaxID=88036 RepID=D8RTL2_SELML|nr:hypothetical protein SELMODRAFT_414688 [Selaginella moellendorffii]